MDNPVHWYAIKTPRVFEAERCLGPLCRSVYLPKETVRHGDGRADSVRAVIPRLMFIQATESEALSLEERSQDPANRLSPFWIYRNIARTRLQPITDTEISLIRLLTSEGTDRCEVYRKDNIREGDRIRVIAGTFAGYEGYARRIRRNKHVVVEIQGICAVALPFIHPDLLERIHPITKPIPDNTDITKYSDEEFQKHF